MTPEQILQHPAEVLDDAERRFYFEQGYLHLEAFLKPEVLADLRFAYQELIDRYRGSTASDNDVLIESDHTPETPRLKRINRATDQHPIIWAYAANSALTKLVSDLVGPSVRFRESYINCKAPRGGDAIDWHQDFPFYPHTNRALLTVLTFLEDVTVDMGPIMVLPKSHRGTLYDHYNEDGSWAGKVADSDLAKLDMTHASTLCGPAGTIVVFDCCMVHGSQPNRSSHHSRPLLLTGYSSADAFCYTSLPDNMHATQAFSIVRGEPAAYAHHDPVNVKIPPDWGRERYVNIFDAQK